MSSSFLLNAGGYSFFEKLGNILKGFSNNVVANIFDILFLAFILFFVVRFIRGRKAGVVLIGIAILLVITGLSSIFNLTATQYVFKMIFEVGIIALVIIFQPEIRDGLEKVGSGSISGLMSFGEQKKKEQISQMIDNICIAVSDLSAKKTGALIVISRTTKLDDITSTGVRLNAEVSSFLLRNLFFNNAPLHDGAVVIDDGKIASAGCLLPLTRRTDIDSDLGTRHRAGIGMSEVSDAVIVIVSEETGTISVAFDCGLTRDFTSDTLRKFLMQKLIRSDRHSSDSEKSENE